MRTASEGRDTHMLKQPGHFTSMKKEFGDCTRRFSLWRFSSSSRGGCSRSISPIEMPACESRERARGLSAKSERYERRPQAGQRSANAEESPAAVAAVQRQICRRSASDGVGAAKRWYHYQLRADHRRAARAGHPSATRTMVAAAVRLCERRAGRPRGEKVEKYVGTGNSQTKFSFRHPPTRQSVSQLFHGPTPRSPLHRLAVRLRHSRSNTSTEYSLPPGSRHGFRGQVFRLTSLLACFGGASFGARARRRGARRARGNMGR